MDKHLEAGNRVDLESYVPQHFAWEQRGMVGVITLNRPERKNPLTFESYAELRDLFRTGRGAWYVAMAPGGEVLASCGIVATGDRGRFQAVETVEIRPEALDGVTPEESAVPALEPVELVAIAGVERAQLAVDLRGIEQPLLELVERPFERVDEAGVCRGARIAMEIGTVHDAAYE